MPAGQTPLLGRTQARHGRWRARPEGRRTLVVQRPAKHLGAGPQHFQGQQAEGGQLAAGQGHATGLDPQRMLARLVRGFSPDGAVADHRTHPGPGRQQVAGRDRRSGKLLGAGRQQVLHFLDADPCLLIQRLGMIEIGGTDHSRTFPGKDEHRPPILLVHKAEGMGHRQTPGRQQQMAAAQRPHMLAAAFPPQSIGPGAGGLGHDPAAKTEAPAAFAILAEQADHPPVVAQQFDHLDPVERLAPVAAGLAQHAHDQAGVIGQRIEEARAAEQTVLLEAGGEIAQLLQREVQVVALARQGVV
ncbi:hypothetical protein D3C85_893170 [compost metagenome]